MSDLREFFIVAAPGLEKIVDLEIRLWFPDLPTQVHHGGITVYTTFSKGCSMNYGLKTATRILCRIEQFRCRDFPKLHRKVREIEWTDWIPKGGKVVVHATSKGSRLKIKKRIEDTVEKAIAKSLGAGEPTSTASEVYVRIADDECTLSLDTSGERLHKRSLRKFVGEAPLRESIAAAMLLWLWQSFGRPEKIQLVDPMMGSGTFLLEAQSLFKLSHRRVFSFESLGKKDSLVPPNIPSPFAQLFGFEKDEHTFRAATQNLRPADQKNIELMNRDFMEADRLKDTDGLRWVVTNPPYGQRIKIAGDLKSFYEDVFEQIARIAKPHACLMLLPKIVTSKKLKLPVGWRVKEKLRLSNGGIPVEAFIFSCEKDPV